MNQKKILKIALAHDWLTSWAGSEQLLYYLHKIFPQAPIYTTIYNQTCVKLNPQVISHKIKTRSVGPSPQRRFDEGLIRSSWLQKIPGSKSRHEIFIPLMPLAISWDFSGYDLVISDCSWAMKGIKTGKKTKHIAIILTPTRWLWNFGSDKRGNNIIAKPFLSLLKKWDLSAAQRPDLLVAISKTVQKRIRQIYQRDSVVVYPPVNTAGRVQPVRKNFQSVKQNDYFLSVGRLVEYKRIDLIIRACNATKDSLKIIGRGPEEKKLRKLAGPTIEFLGMVSDEERDRCYQEAKGFIFAAEEDFGIVPVEAMAAGKPVIAFNKGGATETVIDRVNGLFFQQQNESELVRAIEEFKTIEFDAQKIRQSVQKFSVENFSDNILKLVQDLF